jgi:hypothetical protein
MSSSKVIVAINKDPGADLQSGRLWHRWRSLRVAPALNEEFKKLLASK